VKSYAYFDAALRGANIDAMLDSLREIPAGDVICLHACCHNPTGADPSSEQWKQIADTVYERGIIPLLDFAYLGFGDGIVEDCAALREFSRPGTEMFVCSSYSKNFGLYSERVGAVSAITRDADTAKIVASQLKSAIRTNYSNPPQHGGAIVETILNDASLRSQWEQELADMRNRINGMRKLFTKTMAEILPGTDFSHIEKQRGMFSYSGLTAAQVDALKDQHSIYAVRDGRINVAGISESNCETLCQAIAAVL
jgi:aspartate/tyrosine/aromatic aminotransferase